MIKLVAFDWNGTLLADTQVSVDASNLTLRHFGHKPIGLLRYQETFAVPISQFWLAVGGKKADLTKMRNDQNQIFNSFYEPRAKKVRTRAGAKPVLKWLKKNHIQAIIYSNHTFSGIELQLKRLKIKSYITKTIARTEADGAEHVNNRTKNRKLYDYIKQHKFKPSEIISIGDTEEEIEIGKRHGFHTIGITGGYNTTARLKKHHPDFLIHNMLELKKIIKKLNTPLPSPRVGRDKGRG